MSCGFSALTKHGGRENEQFRKVTRLRPRIFWRAAAFGFRCLGRRSPGKHLEIRPIRQIKHDLDWISIGRSSMGNWSGQNPHRTLSRASWAESPVAAGGCLLRESNASTQKASLDESENALQEYVKKTSITMVDGRRRFRFIDRSKTYLDGSSRDLEADLGGARVETDSRLKETASLRGQLQSRTGTHIRAQTARTSMLPPRRSRERWPALRLERDALLQDFKPTSRHVRDIDTQIEMAERRLEQARADMTYSGYEANPVFVRLKGDLLTR